MKFNSCSGVNWTGNKWRSIGFQLKGEKRGKISFCLGTNLMVKWGSVRGPNLRGPAEWPRPPVLEFREGTSSVKQDPGKHRVSMATTHGGRGRCKPPASPRRWLRGLSRIGRVVGGSFHLHLHPLSPSSPRNTRVQVEKRWNEDHAQLGKTNPTRNSNGAETWISTTTNLCPSNLANL